ncbi:uncharacterized protein LOC131644319 [Vicia villosa]|uniref:uncharacterized protein LOC131644319 n=1 Tax=Vicia villosa TaxID=3911 RepID=UPI00273C5F9C|nr:uncharacterized protein LOC131644319 [Vicia villosa]
MMMSQSQSHHSRRMLPPVNTRKRKHNEADKPDKLDKPIASNKLLAGYLAHEFLTKGTLLGQKFDPELTRASIYPGSRAEASDVRKEHESYGEVASIMKMDGTHIKGIVNPTQLSQWIRM